MKKKIKRDYKSRGRKWFIEFLPAQIYYSFNEEEKTHYLRYRDYHRYMDGRLRKVEKLQKELLVIKNEIKKHREKIDGIKIDGIIQTDGFKSKMLYHYDFVKQFDTKIQFDCWVELKDKSSLSYKKRKGIPIKNIRRKTDKPFDIRSTYKGEPIKKITKWYSYVRTTIEGKKTKKSIYCGSVKDVRELIGKLFDEDTSSWKIDELKDDIKILTRQFTRYTTYHSNWGEFRLGTYNLTKMVDWGLEIGDEQRYNWG